MSPTELPMACVSCSDSSPDATVMIREHRTLGAMNRLSGWGRRAALLVLVLMLTGCGKEVLFSHLTSEQSANQVIAALMHDGISAEKRVVSSAGDRSWQVLVSRDQLGRATEILTAQGLPKEPAKTFCDVFKGEGFVSSQVENKGRYRCALAQSIAETLRHLSGVIDASVQVAIPEENPLAGNKESASASVVIVSKPNAPVLQQEADIKAIVKNAVTGLVDSDHVAVNFSVQQPAKVTPREPGKELLPGIRTSDLGPGVLIGVAVLLVLFALTLFWQSRSTLRRMVAGKGASEKVPGRRRER